MLLICTQDEAATSAATVEPTDSRLAIKVLHDAALPHNAVRQWVVFSDLHVRAGSLSVCLAVLDRVRREAEARPHSGVLFLGAYVYNVYA
jgi:hypothetical protein